MSDPSRATALDDCRIWRPAGLDSSVEVVSARPADRAFPLRVSRSLGVCLKLGGVHEVFANGRILSYPADAICVRAPGCVWSCASTGVTGFYSIDIEPHALPQVVRATPMTFLAPQALPELGHTLSSLAQADSNLERQEAIAELVLAIGRVVRVDELRDSGPHGVVARACELIVTRLVEAPTLDELALQTGCNKFVLVRRFKRELGITPHKYLVAQRIDRARELLARGQLATDVAASLGFADLAHFIRSFKKNVGMTPRGYARLTRATA